MKICDDFKVIAYNGLAKSRRALKTDSLSPKT